MPTGKLHHRQKRHDRFYTRAKQENFAARSVYKLEEIDKRMHVLRKGMRVLDLGYWPGSWLQYAAQVVGPSGVLVGVDRFELDIDLPHPHLRLMVNDVFDVSLQELRGDLPGFDVVLSDMAPDTSGIRLRDQAGSERLFERALDVAEALLVPGGNFVGKLFQGPEWNQILTRCRHLFEQVRTIKPESTRKESIEQYVVGQNKKL